MELTKDEIKRFLKIHVEIVLSALAIFLSAIVIVFYIWGIASLTASMSTAIIPPSMDGMGIGFNLDEARALDFKGLKE